jgi:hypothetical protein
MCLSYPQSPMCLSQLPSPKSCSFNKLMSTLHHAPSSKNMWPNLTTVKALSYINLSPSLKREPFPPSPPHVMAKMVCVCVYIYIYDIIIVLIKRSWILILWTFFFHEKAQDFCNDIIIEYFDHNFNVKPKGQTLSIQPIRMFNFELNEFINPHVKIDNICKDEHLYLIYPQKELCV